jgi:hypothetical protein
MKEKNMFPYFNWHQPRHINPPDQRSAAKAEDMFYAQYGGLSISARVRKTLEAVLRTKDRLARLIAERLQPTHRQAFVGQSASLAKKRLTRKPLR